MSIKRGVFYTFLTQFPNAILGVFSGIFITRTLGAEGKGIFSIFQSNTALLSMFIGLNIGMGIIYFISTNKYSAAEILGATIKIITISFIVGILLFLTLIQFNSIFDLFFPSHFPFGIEFFIILITTLFTVTHAVFNAFFQAKKNFKVVNQVSLINSGINFISFTLIYFLFLKEKNSTTNLTLIISATLALYCTNTLIWLVYYVKIIGKWPEFKNTIPSILLKFILIGYIANLINLLNYRLDIWIINLYETDTQLGYYSLASNIAQIFFMISAPITLVLQPYINSDDSSKTNERLKLFSRINFTLILALCVFTFFISPIALPLVYGQEFSNSINSLNYLLPGILFSCATQVFALLPIKQNKVIYNLIATSVGLIITLTLDLLLIPKLGITGASIASSIAYFCIFITVMYFCFIKLGVPKGNYFILTLNDIKNLRKNE